MWKHTTSKKHLKVTVRPETEIKLVMCQTAKLHLEVYILVKKIVFFMYNYFYIYAVITEKEKQHQS